MAGDSTWRDKIHLLHRESYGWCVCCCNYDHEMAKDVLQTVYLKIYEERAVFAERSDLRTWLFSVIRNTSIDVIRKRGHHPEKLTEAHLAIPEQVTSHENREPIFLDILRSLSPQQREVLTLAFYHDFTLAEIAISLELSIGTVRTHYERGKENFRKFLAKHHITAGNYE